jgi:ABC-2 type transport system ATP-binding protein
MDKQNIQSEPAISCKSVSKKYDTIEALKGIDFTVERGEIFGIIGPDGAGKTTLFRILTTLILADTGTAFVDGFDVVKDYKEIRKRVGYMPGKFSLYQDMTVEENLNFFATVFNTTIEENYELVKDIYQQIEPFKNRRAGKLSGGMKQKLALSSALIHKPSVLFLDEPTTGVDPVSRKEFWGMLKNLKAQGITILVSTPLHGRSQSVRPDSTDTERAIPKNRHTPEYRQSIRKQAVGCSK